MRLLEDLIDTMRRFHKVNPLIIVWVWVLWVVVFHDPSMLHVLLMLGFTILSGICEYLRLTVILYMP